MYNLPQRAVLMGVWIQKVGCALGKAIFWLSLAASRLYGEAGDEIAGAEEAEYYCAFPMEEPCPGTLLHDSNSVVKLEKVEEKAERCQGYMDIEKRRVRRGFNKADGFTEHVSAQLERDAQHKVDDECAEHKSDMRPPLSPNDQSADDECDHKE